MINDLVDMHWKCHDLIEEVGDDYDSVMSLNEIQRNLEILLLDAGHSLKGLKLAPRVYGDE
jgi:hypothetical protein